MNIADFRLALAQGFALLVTPGILVLLPFVIAGALTGGRGRAAGIGSGFILGFFVYALLSGPLIGALGIEPGIVRIVALVILFLAGLGLLSDRVVARYEPRVQPPLDPDEPYVEPPYDYGPGFALGLAAGLIWTPCVVPLFDPTPFVASGMPTLIQKVVVAAGVALGIGIPVLILTVLAHEIIARVDMPLRDRYAVRKVLGLVMLAVIVFLAFRSNVPKLFERRGGPVIKADHLIDGLARPYPMPEIKGIDQWINSGPLTNADLKGKVTLVQFWSASCRVCIPSYARLQAWHERYRDRGLVVIGVHSSDLEFENTPPMVQAAVDKFGIHYPVAVDSRRETWNSFRNRYWPAYYLADRNGNVVYTHMGDGAFTPIESNIVYLLDQRQASPITAIPRPLIQPPPILRPTADISLGYEYAEHFGGKGSFSKDKSAVYDYKEPVSLGDWVLCGWWRVESDKVVARQTGALFGVKFKARKVTVVMGTSSGAPKEVCIWLDEKPLGGKVGADAPDSVVKIDETRSYEILNQDEAREGYLEIEAVPGVEIQSITFSD